MVVVDTPGYFDTKRTNKVTSKVISNGVKMLRPGFHAIVLVMGLGRFTDEEKKVAREIQKILNVNARDYMILLFTRKADLKGRPLQSFLATGDKELNDLVEQCGHRCIAFNNNATGKERQDQVAELLAIVDRMTVHNSVKPLYTPAMFEEDCERVGCCTIL